MRQEHAAPPIGTPYRSRTTRLSGEFQLKAALTRSYKPRTYELRSLFRVEFGEPRRHMREPLFQAQERALQPFEGGNSQQKCNRKPEKHRECVAVIVPMIVQTGENAIRYLPAQVVKRVQAIGDVAEIDEPGILQKSSPLAGSSEEREEDSNTRERHERIPDHAAQQRRRGITRPRQRAEVA